MAYNVCVMYLCSIMYTLPGVVLLQRLRGGEQLDALL